jgi:hypothetical protein
LEAEFPLGYALSITFTRPSSFFSEKIVTTRGFGKPQSMCDNIVQLNFSIVEVAKKDIDMLLPERVAKRHSIPSSKI